MVFYGPDIGVLLILVGERMGEGWNKKGRKVYNAEQKHCGLFNCQFFWSSYVSDTLQADLRRGIFYNQRRAIYFSSETSIDPDSARNDPRRWAPIRSLSTQWSGCSATTLCFILRRS